MAWRVFCDPDSAAGKGCGHAPCVRLAGTLSGRCLSAACLAFFILALLAGVSVRAAWKACGTVLSLRSGYRTRARLGQCQSVLRTRVSARGPPRAERRTETAFLATLEMLTESLGRDDTVCVYQRTFQRGFLSLA